MSIGRKVYATPDAMVVGNPTCCVVTKLALADERLAHRLAQELHVGERFGRLLPRGHPPLN